MIKSIKSITSFFKRNFSMALTSTIFLLVISYFYNQYKQYGNVKKVKKDKDSFKSNIRDDTKHVSATSSTSQFGNRSQILFRLRRQFLIGVFHLAPTFKKKLTTHYDVLKLSKEIKRIRKSNLEASSDNSKSVPVESLELMLWEDLKIQLHVMGNTIYNSVDSSQFDNNFFLKLFEGTFSNTLHKGVASFSKQILPIVKEESEKINLYVNAKYNTSIPEKDLAWEIDLPTFSYLTKRILSRINFLQQSIIPEVSASDSDSEASFLLDKIWDIVESPAFSFVLDESIHSLLDYTFNILRLEVFQATDSSQKYSNNFGSVPLASLLPHLRKISSNILEVGDNLSLEENVLPEPVKSASQGENLETLCLAIFNT